MKLVMLMKIVVGEIATMNEHYANIKNLQKIIHEDILGDQCDLNKLTKINRQLSILMDSLNYWFFYNNIERYNYDLKSFIAWLKKIK